MVAPNNLTDEALFALLAEHAQVMEYLLQYRIANGVGGAEAYLLRVAGRHVRESLSFARSGLGIKMTPVEAEKVASSGDGVLARMIGEAA